MKEVELTRGKTAIVDDQWYEYLVELPWVAIRDRTTGNWYARTERDGQRIYMHHWIAGAPEGRFVNHKNRNTLDNRRRNLRLAPERRKRQRRGKRKGR